MQLSYHNLPEGYNKYMGPKESEVDSEKLEGSGLYPAGKIYHKRGGCANSYDNRNLTTGGCFLDYNKRHSGGSYQGYKPHYTSSNWGSK